MAIKNLIPRSLIKYGRHLPTALLANFVYRYPSRGLKVVGITGTDGKTTTVNMLYQILKDAGMPVSMVSTINANIAGKSHDTGFHVTSPSPFQLQKLIKQVKDNHDKFLVLEVTSHALDQYRTHGIKFDVAVITNITHEHLDYHKTFDNYLLAKAQILKGVKTAILNIDDRSFSKLNKLAKNAQVVTFGRSKKASINLTKFPLKLKIPGKFNELNALAAAATAQALGIPEKTIRRSLNHFQPLSGRMEIVTANHPFKVIIDFAHTPNALQNALETIQTWYKPKRLIAVFGAAAERDQGKRPLMGNIASEYADIVILTNEDPRKENPEKILNDIKSGMKKTKLILDKSLFLIPDRTQAINQAVKIAKPGDVIGIFGKGHETSMNIKGKELPWSDHETVRAALKGV